jgi:hypothetical protein
MKRLILTSSSGTELARAGLAASVLPVWFRFVWGPLPSPQKLDAYFGAGSDPSSDDHWSDWLRWSGERDAVRHLTFIEYCASFDRIELWFDPDPNDQLQLACLLDHVRSHPETVAKLELRLVSFYLMMIEPTWKGWSEVPLVKVRPAHVEAASEVWRAYRASTPEACFDALRHDLSAFPLLRPALLDLLQELPWRGSGLGATEMRLLELISAGFMGTNVLFYLRGFRQRSVFKEMEIGTLLQGLAQGPDSTTNCAPSTRRISRIASRLFSEAGCRRRSLARQCSPTRRISPITIRSIAGGAAHISPTTISGAGIPR